MPFSDLPGLPEEEEAVRADGSVPAEHLHESAAVSALKVGTVLYCASVGENPTKSNLPK